MSKKSRAKHDPYKGYMHAENPRMLAVLKALADHGAVIAFSQDGDDAWLWHAAKSFSKLPPDVNFGRVAGEGYVGEPDDGDDESVRSPGHYALTPKGLALVAASSALASVEDDIVRATTPSGGKAPKAAAKEPDASPTPPPPPAQDAIEVLSRALDDRLRQDAVLRQNDPVAAIAEAMALVGGLGAPQLMAAARQSYRTASMAKMSERRASYERDLRMVAALGAGPAEAGAAKTLPEMIGAMRRAGWAVAVHNDYRLKGQAHTFWLWTNAESRCVKGEGLSDAEALSQCLEKAGLA